MRRPCKTGWDGCDEYVYACVEQPQCTSPAHARTCMHAHVFVCARACMRTCSCGFKALQTPVTVTSILTLTMFPTSSPHIHNPGCDSDQRAAHAAAHNPPPPDGPVSHFRPAGTPPSPPAAALSSCRHLRSARSKKYGAGSSTLLPPPSIRCPPSRSTPVAPPAHSRCGVSSTQC
eukprot:125800-Chlamydomonas_euryale.AAC.3